MDYLYKTDPLDHQREIFDASRDMPYAAYLMDRGTGKSKIVLDVAAYLRCQGLIDCLIVTAPNGVHQNWIEEEIPLHFPDYIPVDVAYYNGGLKKKERDELEKIWEPNGKFKIITINIESASNKTGVALIKKILQLFTCMWAEDESHDISKPTSNRTKACLRLSRFAKYKRILTGTALTKNILDLYTQFKFLDPTILHYTSFTAFRSHYAILERKETSNNKLGYYIEVVDFQNQDELIRRISPFSFVVKKQDCLDLPPRTFEKRHYKLPKKLREHYNNMLEHSMTVVGNELNIAITTEEQLWEALVDDEGVIKSKNGMTTLLKLQQITNGFIFDKDGVIIDLEDKNTRISILLSILKEISGKVIIWARFIHDLRAIVSALRKEYGADKVAAIYGEIDKKDRDAAKENFKHGEVDFLVANQLSAGTGYTFIEAETAVYYSNDFRMEKRLQSQDRIYRYGQTKNTLYVDIVADDTIDLRILQTLLARAEDLETITDRIADEQNLRS